MIHAERKELEQRNSGLGRKNVVCKHKAFFTLSLTNRDDRLVCSSSMRKSANTTSSSKRTRAAKPRRSENTIFLRIFMSSNASATCGAHGEQSGTPLSARRNGVFRSTWNATELCDTNGSQAVKALHEAANTRVDLRCQSQPNASGPCYIGRIGGFGLAGPPLRPTQPTSCLEQSRPHVDIWPENHKAPAGQSNATLAATWYNLELP